MVLVTGNWRLWTVGMLASLAIFVVVYFTVIQPTTNTANQALKTGMQQTQQVIKQAKQQLNSSGVSGGAASQANQQLDKASKLTSCVSAAGTDPSKLANCQSQYGG